MNDFDFVLQRAKDEAPFEQPRVRFLFQTPYPLERRMVSIEFHCGAIEVVRQLVEAPNHCQTFEFWRRIVLLGWSEDARDE